MQHEECPNKRAEGQVSVPPARGEKSVIAAQPILENSANSGKSSKASPFAQIVDTIAKGFTTSRSVEQTQAIEASRRATVNQGQSDSVRYITGVELAIILAAGGVTKLRSDKVRTVQISSSRARRSSCKSNGDKKGPPIRSTSPMEGNRLMPVLRRMSQLRSSPICQDSAANFCHHW